MFPPIYTGVYTSWASQGAARMVDWLCPAQLYVFWHDFWHGVPYTLDWDAIPSYFFPGCMTDRKMRKNEKVTITSVKKQTKKGWFGIHLHVRFKCVVKFSVPKVKKLSGASQISRYFVITWFIYGIVFLVISLDGWRIGQWNLYRCCSMCLQHCLHQFSPWSKTMNFWQI